MITIQLVDQTLMIAYWLCFTRCLASFINIPILDEAAIPGVIKVLCALVFSYAIFPTVQEFIFKDIQHYGIDSFWLLTAYYTISGLVLSYLVKLLSLAFVSSGTLIAQQIGLGNISLFDPTSLAQVGPIEKIMRWGLLMMLCASGALYPILKGIVLSFDQMTIIGFDRLTDFQIFFQGFFKTLFTSALLLASPFMFTALLMNFILGIISRVVPQINVIMMSFILSIISGLFVFYLVGDELFRTGEENYLELLGTWFQFVTFKK